MSDKAPFALLLLLLGAWLLSGCAPKQTQTIYNYQGYSHAYYQAMKESSEESRLALQQEIISVINAQDKGLSGRVPPGMYANLGYIYLLEGNAKLATENFTLEMQTYPESQQFMELMINQTNRTKPAGAAQ
jgi:hypothetical protein